MSSEQDFLLNGDSDVVKLETLEISHPSFELRGWVDFGVSARRPTSMFIVTAGTDIILTQTKPVMIAVLEDGSTTLFHYCPATLKFSNQDETLNREIEVGILDLGDVIRRQFKLIEQKNKIGIRPKLIYRAYRSDDLDSQWLGL